MVDCVAWLLVKMFPFCYCHCQGSNPNPFYNICSGFYTQLHLTDSSVFKPNPTLYRFRHSFLCFHRLQIWQRTGKVVSPPWRLRDRRGALWSVDLAAWPIRRWEELLGFWPYKIWSVRSDLIWGPGLNLDERLRLNRVGEGFNMMMPRGSAWGAWELLETEPALLSEIDLDRWIKIWSNGSDWAAQEETLVGLGFCLLGPGLGL